MKTPIYLDYAATTPADPAVVAVMTRHLGPDGMFGNPASRRHGFGRDAGGQESPIFWREESLVATADFLLSGQSGSDAHRPWRRI